MDILLSHGYFLRDDAVEQEVMKPYPPLGLLYLSSYLKRSGFSVEVFDSTCHGVYGFSYRFRSPQNVADEVELLIRTYQPDMLWYADDVFRDGQASSRQWYRGRTFHHAGQVRGSGVWACWLPGTSFKTE